MRNEKKAIDSIILINPLIYRLQDKIDEEQENVISDLTLPAEKAVSRLIELDNRRIDLCNLKVLYGFIERGLGERFALLRSCVYTGEDCGLYGEAVLQTELAGYSAKRVLDEFAYLFKLIGHRRKKRVVVRERAPMPYEVVYSSEPRGFLNR